MVEQRIISLQVFLQADRLKDAVSSLVAVGEWDRARRIVRELAPDLEPYLEEKYRDAMANEGEMERLAKVDGNAALEVMARKGQWSQVFDTASSQSPEVLHRFVARRAAQLLKSDSAPQALQLYAQYGAPAISQNFNLYLQLAESILNMAQQEYRYDISLLTRKSAGNILLQTFLLSPIEIRILFALFIFFNIDFLSTSFAFHICYVGGVDIERFIRILCSV